MIAEIERFLKLAEMASVIRDSKASWETKYGLVFSDQISIPIREMESVNIDYCDPDTSYEEDVCAYVQALEEKAKELKSIEW